MTDQRITNRDQYMAYMRGWRHGAGFRAMTPELSCHDSATISEAYGQGYSDGRRASSRASAVAALRYSYEPTALRLQDQS